MMNKNPKPQQLILDLPPIHCFSCKKGIKSMQMSVMPMLDTKTKKWFNVLLTRCPHCNETFTIKTPKDVIRNFLKQKEKASSFQIVNCVKCGIDRPHYYKIEDKVPVRYCAVCFPIKMMNKDDKVQ